MIRSQRRLVFATIPLTLALLVGCLGEPIPRRVVSGTTFSFAYPDGVFGAATSAGPLMSSDAQRGNVRFALCPLMGACSSPKPLILRYTTRVFPDPGSRLGLSGETEFKPADPNAPVVRTPASLVGEPIVVVDVPSGTTPAKYMLTSFVDPPGPAAEMMTSLQEIEIVAPPPLDTAAQFTNLSRLVNFSNGDATLSLKGLVPYPQLRLLLADTSNLDDRPAAGTIVVRCPSSVRIQGAFETGVLGQNSIVRFKTASDNTVTILFMDPDRRLTSISLAFELINATGPAVQLSEFTVASQDLYTTSGAPLTVTDVVSSSGNKFQVSTIR